MLYRESLENDSIDLLKISADRLNVKIKNPDKNEMVKEIEEAFLKKKNIEERLLILDDDTFSLWEKAAEGPVVYNVEKDKGDQWLLSVLDLCNSKVIERRGVFFATKMEVETYSDVWMIYKNKIAGDEFNRKRKRSSWVWKCLEWANWMYVYTPINVLHKLVNVKKNSRYTKKELYSIVKSFPTTLPRCKFQFFEKEDVIIFDEKAPWDEVNTLGTIMNRQGVMSYYIPEIEELEEYVENKAILSGEPYQAILKYMLSDLGLDADAGYGILSFLWQTISREGFNPERLFFRLSVAYDVDVYNESSINKWFDMYYSAWKVTNTCYYRGFSPQKLFDEQAKSIMQEGIFEYPDNLPYTRWYS